MLVKAYNTCYENLTEVRKPHLSTRHACLLSGTCRAELSSLMLFIISKLHIEICAYHGVLDRHACQGLLGNLNSFMTQADM